jgi:hypothetical protein
MINITLVLLLVYQLSCFWSLQEEAPHSIVEEATGKKMAYTQITVLKTLTLEQSRKMSTALTAAAAAAEVENLFLRLSWVQEPALTCSARCWEDDLWCKGSRDWRHFEDCSSWLGVSGKELLLLFLLQLHSLSGGECAQFAPAVGGSQKPGPHPEVIKAVIRALHNPAPPLPLT